MNELGPKTPYEAALRSAGKSLKITEACAAVQLLAVTNAMTAPRKAVREIRRIKAMFKFILIETPTFLGNLLTTQD
jgi:hypothetical protein